MQDRVAIRLGDENRRYLLVRHSRQGDTFYSFWENKGETKTVNWDEAKYEEKMLLFDFVKESLEDGERTGGESNLLELFLILDLRLNRNSQDILCRKLKIAECTVHTNHFYGSGLGILLKNLLQFPILAFLLGGTHIA